MRLQKLAKKLAVACVLGTLLCAAPLATEAATYTGNVQGSSTGVDRVIGYDGDYLTLQARFNAKFKLSEQCATEYVLPYFEKKGITQSVKEATAIAYAALEYSNISENFNGEQVVFAVKGTVYSEDRLDLVFEDKKYLQAFLVTYNNMHDTAQGKLPATKSYVEYNDKDSAEVLRTANEEMLSYYNDMNNMSEYWTPGVALVLTGDDVNFRSAPSTDSEVIGSLKLGEELKPCGDSVEEAGRRWYQAIDSAGKLGYVSADFVRLAC